MPDISVILKNPGFAGKDLATLIDNLITEDGVEIVLTDPGYMRVLNRKYRHIDRSTDVLAFDLTLTGKDRPDGTIYIDGRLFPPIDALLERIFHGYLHLKGYSHNTEYDARVMNSKVESLLADARRKKVNK